MQKARFVRTTVEGDICWGVVEGDVVYRLDATPLDAWTRGEALGHQEELTLLAPATPTKIVCIGRNYPAHAAEHAAEVPAEPLLFFKPPSSVIGPGAPIVLTPQSKQVEHESELVVVIGRRCRNVSPAEAWDCVLGVTCGNDVTARDLQRQDSQWTRAKGFDTFCPLGPWLVTGLSEKDAADLEVTCRVNGEVRQRGNTGEMVFSPAQLIAYISAIMTLEPGDAIMTGTPAGVSSIVAGDEVEVEVESIGVLRNPVTW
ncbi:MAG: fumarylacetoacetate hydrolase family protein [Anaerolineae bacterium]|nr:fumarylacetoacetate hydrolase family protein [Anaerolineae bacterium]